MIGNFVILAKIVSSIWSFIRVSTKWQYFLHIIRANFAQIFFLRSFMHLMRMKRSKFLRFAQFFLRKLCKPEILSKTLIFTQNLLLQINSFSAHIKIDYDFAALNLLLLFTKSLNWGIKIIKQKLEIWKLKIDVYWCTLQIKMCTISHKSRAVFWQLLILN